MPPSLLLFATFYGGMACMAGVLGNKQIWLGPLAMEGGLTAFIQLVIIASAVAELHGAKVAGRLVLFGFAPLIMSIGLIGLLLALPAADGMNPARLAAFHTLLSQSPRLMLAGIVAYGISQLLNVTLFTALRGAPGGRMVGLRAAVAGAISQVVDTIIFITVGFYGLFPIAGLMAGHMAVKVALSLTLVPVAVTLLVRLGRRLDRPRPA